MKKLLCTFLGVILALTMTGMGSADGNEFTTRIEIAGFADSCRLIARIHDGVNYSNWRFDTVYVVNRVATIHDVSKIKEPARMYVFTDSGTITTYVRNGVNECISGVISDIERESLRYDGAPWSADMMVYNNDVGHLYSQINLKSKIFKTLSEEERSELFRLSSLVDSLQTAYLINYPNSWHALSILETKMMDMPKQELQTIYDALEAEQRQSKYGDAILNYLSTATIELGDSLHNFNILAKGQNGNDIDLMKVEEPFILLDFSQCYCGPCIAVAKEIHAIKDKYAGKVAFINYSCDDSDKDWMKMVDRDNITWVSMYNGEGPTGTTCLKYKVNSYPTFFLFGPDRTLLDRTEGYGPSLLDLYLKKFVK